MNTNCSQFCFVFLVIWNCLILKWHLASFLNHSVTLHHSCDLWFLLYVSFEQLQLKFFVWLFVLIALSLVIILDNFSPDMRNGPLNFFTSSPPHALGPCHLQNRITASSHPQSVSVGDMMGWRGVCLLSAHVIRMPTTWIPNWILWKRSPTKFSFKMPQFCLSFSSLLLIFPAHSSSFPPS